MFAAYANNLTSEETEKIPEDSSTWLENKSFPQNAAAVSNSEPSISQVKKPSYQKPIPAKVEVQAKSVEFDQNEIFSIDKSKEKLLFTIQKQNCPKYYARKFAFYGKSKKRKRSKRYFKTLPAIEDDEIIEPGGESKTQEEDLTKKTAFFNRKLEEDPHDIGLWIEYIRFQDTVYQFEKFFKKGSNVKGARVTAERKLLILEKGLKLNPDSEELHRERVLIAERVYPSDEMSVMMKKLVDLETGNIILWQGYIEATQCSMAHCNTPVVLGQYYKTF